MDKEKNGRVANLFLTNLDMKKEVQLTRGTETNGQPKWLPNGEWILFLSTKPLPKPNPDFSRSQLWLMNPFGGEPWPVTEFARGIQGYEWVDDDTIIFSAQEDAAFYEQEIKRKKDTTRVVDDVGHEPPVRLFKLTVKDRKVARLTDNTDFIQSWAVTPDGKRAMTVDGQYLSFEWDQKILPKVFLYDLAKGERREILAGRRIIPLAAGARFIPARYVKSGLAWKRTDIEGEHVKNLFGFAVSRDAKVMVYDHSTPSTPSQWYCVALDGNKLTSPVQLTDLNSEFKDKAIARTEIVRWTGALGEEIEGLLYYPRDYQAGKKYPLLTAPHGGPAGVDLDAWDESWAYAHQLRKLEEEMAWFDRWFFKTEKAENEAFKKDSPLGQAIRRKGIAKAGLLYGIQSGAGKTLVPEVVKRGDLEIGRFEVTRAQYAAFDPKFKMAPGTENYPATGISFDEAQAYAAWLSKLTGQVWRVPNEDEAAKLSEGLAGENTLDSWAGYALNPDDARRLEAKVKELGGAPQRSGELRRRRKGRRGARLRPRRERRRVGDGQGRQRESGRRQC